MGISYLENVNLDSTLNYVRAKTPRGLRRAMLQNNLRLKAFIKYETPYRDSDGYLYAWYYEPTSLEQLERLSDGE